MIPGSVYFKQFAGFSTSLLLTVYFKQLAGFSARLLLTVYFKQLAGFSVRLLLTVYFKQLAGFSARLLLTVYFKQLAGFSARLLLTLFTKLGNFQQVVSARSISSVEWSSALRHGVKRDWSRCALTLVFLQKRGNRLTDTGNIPIDIDNKLSCVSVQAQVGLETNISPIKISDHRHLKSFPYPLSYFFNSTLFY
jgi:hypothetical protein